MKKGTSRGAFFIGGEEGDRTLDLRIANATLSQLSYFPNDRILAKPLEVFSLQNPPADDAGGDAQASRRLAQDSVQLVL